MDVCVVKLHQDTKSLLDKFREYRNESYDEVVRKLIGIVKNCKKEPELSSEAVERIEEARKRIKAGDFVTEEEARKRLGL
ncbi:hypothetical protein COV61_00690 [Candidatus Micrarchaeota archaeon CG11_big_fil_rev_8_21_14_0_20_47_5]|nr:MAG: hypothetical protein AUJ17_04595 [Candidatus Micrarchaeota archaeon CG1_02_47_40]PIN84239.1 MAG: hypothetical protein COV61_00690 [Candidatus Micrarchaeota archaeon CG11_big_fil_rev_8_21_14_0_20_47_5]